MIFYVQAVGRPQPSPGLEETVVGQAENSARRPVVAWQQYLDPPLGGKKCRTSIRQIFPPDSEKSAGDLKNIRIQDSEKHR